MAMEPEPLTTESDKRSSIELSRNAKGEYSYHAKLYFDDDPDGENMRRAMSRVQGIVADLDAKYMKSGSDTAETPF